MSKQKLNRDSNSRVALFKAQVAALIEHEEITTTDGKAKAVKGIFEQLLSKAKTGTVHARRQIQSVLIHNHLIKKVIDEIAPRYKDVKGGYTKVTFVGRRKGDGAMLVKLALTKKVASGSAQTNPERAKRASGPKASQSAPKVATPRVAKATKTVKMSVNKAAMVRKTGER